MARGSICRRAGAAAVLVLWVSHDAHAFRMPFPVQARARLDLRLSVDEATAPWPWDAASRSPLDGSRFMADVTAGDTSAGVLYVKGVADWQATDDASGRVAFRLDQGDYGYRAPFADSSAVELRAFADERRFFFGELGVESTDDDAVARFQHRLGARADATHGWWNASYLAAELDQGRDSRMVQRVSAVRAGRHVHAGATYLHMDMPTTDHAVVARGEVGVLAGRVSALMSFAASGTGSGVFLPSASFGSAGSGYAPSAPDNSATDAELRARRLPAGENLRVDAVYRYRVTGRAYANDLAPLPAGTVSNQLGLYVRHRVHALDGALLWQDDARYDPADADRRVVELRAHAMLQDNAELLLRAGAERREAGGIVDTDDGFAHAGYRRQLARFMGGAHALVSGIGDDIAVRTAVESRVNWNATSALYARWIVDDAATRSDAVFARLEFRPTARTWITLAWGREYAGAGPWVVDDRDVLPSTGSENVFTLGVRGDF